MTAPSVFLTGFPGFLGSALLERILDRGDGPVACLVQPAYRTQAERRATEILDSTDTAGGDDSVQLYEGDITEPDLGLGTDREDFESVESVFHLAAVYDLGVGTALAEAVNVEGTEHVLDFASGIDAHHLHYVSTCYVSGRYDGVFTEEHLQEGQSFNNEYERTKYEAEVAVQHRMADGLAATIYRPAIVVGDSRTGETDKFDGPYNLVEMLLAQPRWLSAAFTFPGTKHAEMNVVPRNYVVDAIATLSAQSDAAGEVYQLCDPSPPPVERFVDAVADALGHRTLTLPTTKPPAERTVRLLNRMGAEIDVDTLDYLDHPTRYACPNTRRALAGTGIGPPAFDSYVDNLVEYVRQHPETGGDPMV